jgi:MFS family permease
MIAFMDSTALGEQVRLQIDDPFEVWMALLAGVIVASSVMLTAVVALTIAPLSVPFAVSVHRLAVTNPVAVGTGLFAVVIALQVSAHGMRTTATVSRRDRQRLAVFTILAVAVGAVSIVGSGLVLLDEVLRGSENWGNETFLVIGCVILVVLCVDAALVRSEQSVRVREAERSELVRTKARLRGRVRKGARSGSASFVSLSTLIFAPFLLLIFNSNWSTAPVAIVVANLFFVLLASACSSIVALYASVVALTATDRGGAFWFSLGYAGLGMVLLEWIGISQFVHGVEPILWPGIASIILLPACAGLSVALAARDTSEGKGSGGVPALLRRFSAWRLRRSIAWEMRRLAQHMEGTSHSGLVS